MKVHDAVQSLWSSLISSLHVDSHLDAGAAAGTLTATALDLILRFGQYKLHPARLGLMCRTWNPHYMDEVSSFLAMDPRNLDVGVSLPLLKRAWQEGSERKALAFLTSKPVQDSIGDLFQKCTTGRGMFLDTFGLVLVMFRYQSISAQAGSRQKRNGSTKQ